MSELNKHVMSTSHPTLKGELLKDNTTTSTAIDIGLGNTERITATKSKCKMFHFTIRFGRFHIPNTMN